MSLNTLSLGGLDFSNALTAGQHLTVRTGPGDNDFVNVFLSDFRTYMTDFVNQRIDIVEAEVAVPKPSVWPSLRTMTLSGAIGGTVAFDGSVNFTINTTIGDGSLTIAKTSGLQALIDTKLNATANAVSASKLQTARTIALSGTVSGSGLFDGSGNLSIETQIADGTLSIAQTSGLAAQLASKANHAGQDYTGDHNFKDGKVHVWQKSGENQAVVNFFGAAAVLKGRASWNQTDDNVRLQRYNAAGTVVEGDLAVNATTLSFNGNTVWHTGNLNANTFNYLSSAAVNYASGAGANCDTFAAGTKALVHNSNANTPGASSTYWYIETLTTGTDNTNVLQRAWSTSIDEQYFRRCVAGAWGSWRRVWNSYNFDPASKLNSNANAVSASKLLTARGIIFGGAISGSFGFDGSGDVNVVTSIADGSLTIAKVSGLSTELNGKLDIGEAAYDYMGSSATVAPVEMDCDNFAAGTRYYCDNSTANPNAPTSSSCYIETIRFHTFGLIQRACDASGVVYTRAKWVSWSVWRRVIDQYTFDPTTFNAVTASKLKTARTIAVTGVVEGNGLFDGSVNISIATSIVDNALTIAKTSGLQAALDAKLSISAYTAADILTKLKTVDGVASGLDADLLDGQQGNYYWSMGNFDPANKVNVGGDTMQGKLTAVTADAGKASLNIPHATVVPTTPVDGDMWSTTAALYARLGGATRTLATTATWSTVTQIEAEAGVATTNRLWTAERVAQAIAAKAAALTHTHNSFVGNVTLAGDLLPDSDNFRSLGSPSLMWRDVYIGPGSLYLNGQKILEDTESGTIVMRADPGQNISIQSYTTGDIELAPQGSGLIQLKGNVMFDGASLIRSTDGISILFDDSIEFTLGAGIIGGLNIDGYAAWHSGNFNPANKLDVGANATSASKLTTPRSFSLTGPVTATSVNFDGTGNVLLTTEVTDNALTIAKTNGLSTALNSKIDSTLIGTANGVTPLGPDAKIPAQYLPSFVDDTVEASTYSTLPVTGESSKIYVTLDTNLIYRWSGTVYIEISSAAQSDSALRWTTARLLTLAGKVSGSVLIDGSSDVTLNVIGLSGAKADVGLSNVDNTSDANKPISTAQASAIALKLDSSAYTAMDVLAKVSLVDGASSGLDADLLDGQEGSWYQNLANATGTLLDARLSGNVPLKNGANTFSGANTFTNVTVFDGASTHFTPGSADFRIDVANADALAPRLQSYSSKPLYLNELGNQVIVGPSGLLVNGTLTANVINVGGNVVWHAGNFNPALKLDASVYTASDVLVKVKTVDGAGSGLDADLLDGQEGAHYLSLNNMTGVLPVTKGGTGVSSVTAGGYVRGNGTGALEPRTPDEVRKDIGATTFTMSELPPANPNPGDEWVKQSTGIKYTWLVDVDSAQWVNLSGNGQATGPAVQTYIQPQQPANDQPYVWFQNGLGESGEDITMWINIPD